MSFFGETGPLVVAVMWTETIIALVFVLARLYTRARIMRSIGWDDHLIAISMFLFFGYTILITVASTNGFGSHLEDLGLPQAVIAIKWEIAAQTFNIAAIGTSKSSVAVFLLRIVAQRSHIYILWFCVFSTSFVCATCIIFMYTQCTPLESIFNPSLPHQCYLNFTVNAIFSGSYTAFMDFALAIFPWFVLWNLNMKRKERLTIAMGLSLGIFAGVCGIIRAVDLQAIAGKADYTYLTLPLILWGSTELLICIVCASIPILRPLYKQVRGQHSSNAYELGNTPSQPLSASKELDSSTNTKDARSARNTAVMLGSQKDGTGVNTTIFMGGTKGNSSDEQILKDMRGRFGDEDLERDGGIGGGGGGIGGGRGEVYDHTKSIHKTTHIDVSYGQ